MNLENQRLRKELERLTARMAAEQTYEDEEEAPVTTITLEDLDDEPVAKGKRKSPAVTAASQAAAQSKAAKR